jgi:DNA-binding MarR family transcriptional regulator
MPEFLETTDGLLWERDLHELASWFHDQAPEASTIDFEAQFIISRAVQSVTVPQDRAGRKRFNSGRFNVLRILYQSENRRRLMSEIAHALGISITNVTALIDDLVEEGLVRRAGHADDKRKKWAQLTRNGVTTFEAELPGFSAVVRKLWSPLTDEEKTQLVTILAKLRLGLLKNSLAEQVEGVKVLRVPADPH